VEGVILAPRRNPDLQGPCSLATSAVYLIRVNNIPSKFDTLFATPLRIVWQLKRLPAWRLYSFFWQQSDIHGNLVSVGALTVTSLIKQAQSQSWTPGLVYITALVCLIW